jgi:hypothetical protein
MNHAMFKRLVPPGIAIAFALLTGAQSHPAKAAEANKEWRPVEDAALAGLTGRFQGFDGVSIAFAIEVEGLVNGDSVMERSLSANPFALSTGTPQSLAASLSSASKAMTLALQNSADHQTLQLRTVLNIRLTELTAVRALQTQYLLASWQTSASRP